MENIVYRPIGVIHSPFKDIEGMPIQPCSAQGTKGTVEVYEQYRAGLKDLGGFSHIMLLYHFHLVKSYALQARPFLEEEAIHGIFAIRAPARPNPIGISMVRLVSIEDNLLNIEDVDIIDGTPLLDIKPYVPDFDWREVEQTGWYSRKPRQAWEYKSDARFKV